MKIYILPIIKKFQPKSQAYKYPKHNKDFGVEQDFYQYLLNNKDLLTQNYKKADWHFLPAYWTRWHVNHDYAKQGLNELQNEINRIILNDRKTFTICQYDNGPVVNLGNSRIFLSSRMTDFGIDIPLLSSFHKKPFFKIKKKYLASFVGKLSTHSIRKKIASLLQNRKDIYIFDGNKGSRFFVKKMLQSYISLCPRGYGGDSFRFYESMQLGIVPFLIGKRDTRPFKKFINWSKISFFTNNVRKLTNVLDSVNKKDLTLMGKMCQKTYQEKLVYQKWCSLVVKELTRIL